MHVEICACLRLLARLNYIMGDHPEVGHRAITAGCRHCASLITFHLALLHSPVNLLRLQALSNQQKAVLMSERVLGIEHPNTIQEYVSPFY